LQKLTKAQARKRLEEARKKIIMVYAQGIESFSNADSLKLIKINSDLMSLRAKLK